MLRGCFSSLPTQAIDSLVNSLRTLCTPVKVFRERGADHVTYRLSESSLGFMGRVHGPQWRTCPLPISNESVDEIERTHSVGEITGLVTGLGECLLESENVELVYVASPDCVLGVAYSEVSHGNYDGATDAIIEYLDDAFTVGDLEAVERFLSSADVSLLDIQSSLSILSSTMRDRSSLKNRASFLQRLEEKLSCECPDRVGRLLDGFR